MTGSPTATHPRRRALVVAVVGLIVAFIVGVAFAAVLQAAATDWNLGLPWERSLLLSIDRSVPRAIDWVMLVLPWFGTNITVMPILAIFSLWLWRARQRSDVALELMMVATGSLILNAVLKATFDRARPELWPHRGQYQWAAFPSGHAIVGVSVFLTIVLMLWRERRWWWPFVAAIGMLTISLYSRLYLGVHWPTDVLGGVIIGAAWLVGVQLAFRPLHAARGAHSKLGDAPASSPGTFDGRSSIEGGRRQSSLGTVRSEPGGSDAGA